jgi:hypothetical protein
VSGCRVGGVGACECVCVGCKGGGRESVCLSMCEGWEIYVSACV